MAKKQCCKKPNHYYEGNWEKCLNCKFKKRKRWQVGSPITWINGESVY